MQTTVGDLVRSEGTPPPATRAAIEARLAKIDRALSLAFDGLAQLSGLVAEAREMLATDGKDETEDTETEA